MVRKLPSGWSLKITLVVGNELPHCCQIIHKSKETFRLVFISFFFHLLIHTHDTYIYLFSPSWIIKPNPICRYQSVKSMKSVKCAATQRSVMLNVLPNASMRLPKLRTCSQQDKQRRLRLRTPAAVEAYGNLCSFAASICCWFYDTRFYYYYFVFQRPSEAPASFAHELFIKLFILFLLCLSVFNSL